MDEKIIRLLEQQLVELQEIRKRFDTLEKHLTEGGTRPAPASPVEARPAVPKETPVPATVKVIPDTPIAMPTAKRETGKGAVAEPPRQPARPDGMDELKEAIITVLYEAGVPLTFEKVFQKLQTSGASLPGDRPKLMVRKLLYNGKSFKMLRGAFSLNEGVRPGLGPSADASAEPQADSMPAGADAAPAGEAPVPETGSPVQEQAVESPAPAPPPTEITQPITSAIPPGHFTRALEAILGPDARVKVKKENR